MILQLVDDLQKTYSVPCIVLNTLPDLTHLFPVSTLEVSTVIALILERGKLRRKEIK